LAIYSAVYWRKRQRLMARYVIGPDVLDIGYAAVPNPHLRHFHTVGLDTEKAPAPSGYAEEVAGDATKLDSALPGRRFNSIVCGEFIEHVENPYEFLRGLHPFLAEGGRVVLSTPNPLGFPQVVCEAFGIRRFFYNPGHRHGFLPRWMVRVLEVAGFTVLAVRAVGLNLVYLAPPCPKFMSHQLIYVAERRTAGAKE